MFYAFPEREEIEQMIEDANLAALATCEVCGAQGSLGSGKFGTSESRLGVRCDKCRAGVPEDHDGRDG
jgi:hypothetical protein